MWATITLFTETLLRAAQRQGDLDGTVDVHALAVTFVATWIGADLIALDLGGPGDRDAILATVTEIIRRFAPSSEKENR